MYYNITGKRMDYGLGNAAASWPHFFCHREIVENIHAYDYNGKKDEKEEDI